MYATNLWFAAHASLSYELFLQIEYKPVMFHLLHTLVLFFNDRLKWHDNSKAIMKKSKN